MWFLVKSPYKNSLLERTKKKSWELFVSNLSWLQEQTMMIFTIEQNNFFLNDNAAVTTTFFSKWPSRKIIGTKWA